MITLPINTLLHRFGGEKLGSEMIANGSFINAASWSFGTSWTHSTDHAAYDGVATGNLTQSSGAMLGGIAPNTNYRLQFEITNAANAPRFLVGSSNLSVVYIAYANYANGTYTVDFTTGASISVGGIAFYALFGGGAFDFDNVSLKERL